MDQLQAAATVTACEGEAAKGGVLTALLKVALAEYHISVQRYWNATLVGPDVRRLLEVYPMVLAVIHAEMSKIHGVSEADKFVQRHSAVLKELGTISHLSRAARFLTPGELDAFEQACSEFGRVFRLSYPNHLILTVKGHLIEKHMAKIARYYGTLGIFGEDGLEALHPLDSRARAITRTMRNSTARHEATLTHCLLQTHVKPAERSKKRRRSRKFQAVQVHPEPELAAVSDGEEAVEFELEQEQERELENLELIVAAREK